MNSTIDNGGIYVAGLGANTISVTNSTVDATNSQVAASLADLRKFANADSNDLSNVENLAIGLFGDAEQHADDLAGSTVTGDVGLLGVGAMART